MTSLTFPALDPQHVRSALIGATALILLATPATAEEEGGLLWEQDFSQLPAGPTEDFGKNLEIREENGVKFLSKQDYETRFIIEKKSRGAAASGWIDYVYTVRFREPEKSTATLVVKAAGERPEVPYLWYYVSVRPTGISISCHGIPDDQVVGDPRRQSEVTFESMGAATLPPGEWITAKVAVGAEVIKVTVDAGDQQPRAAEFKVFPGTGGVDIASRSPLDVSAASVRESVQTITATP